MDDDDAVDAVADLLREARLAWQAWAEAAHREAAQRAYVRPQLLPDRRLDMTFTLAMRPDDEWSQQVLREIAGRWADNLAKSIGASVNYQMVDVTDPRVDDLTSLAEEIAALVPTEPEEPRVTNPMVDEIQRIMEDTR